MTLFEVLPVTPVIRQFISANTDAESLETHARQAGMRMLLEDGCLVVEQGLTTFEGLIRVLGMPHGGQAILTLAWHNRWRQCARWDVMGGGPCFTAHGTTATDGYLTKSEANRHQFCAMTRR